MDCSVNNYSNQINYSEAMIIDITKFNTMEKLLGVTARVFNIFKGKSFKYALTEPTVENLNSAEKFWINLVQKELGNYWKLRYK